jgi:hypothetical protein
MVSPKLHKVSASEFRAYLIKEMGPVEGAKLFRDFVMEDVRVPTEN